MMPVLACNCHILSYMVALYTTSAPPPFTSVYFFISLNIRTVLLQVDCLYIDEYMLEKTV